MAIETTVLAKIQAQTSGTESVKSLKAQITEATNEATRLAEEFGKFSPQAIEAAKKAADLKEQMGDVQKNIAAIGANKFEKIAAVVGGTARGIQAAQGAMALFGGESENLQKALLRVQGAMAFAEGISGIIALKAAFATLFTSVIAGFRAMSAAMISTGIGAILVLVGTAVSMLIDLFNDQEQETKRLEAETRRLEQAYKDLTEVYEAWSDNHDFITEKIIKKAQRQNASEEEILKLRKARNLSAIEGLEKHMQEVAKQYDEEAKSIKKNTKTRSEEEKQLREMNKRKADQFEAFTKRIRDLRQQDTLFAEDILTAQKQAEEKAQQDAQKRYEDYQRIVKAQQDAERNALQSLNEEKRKLRELDAKDIIQLEQIKLQNEIERLAEQRANALRAENLTKKAIADINAKFDLSEQIARQNSAKAIATIEKERTAKEKAELEERKAAHEKFEEDRKAIEQKSIADNLAFINQNYTNKKNQLILDGATQAEFDKLEIQRLEAQLREVKDYGELHKDETLRIEAELFAKKKEIRDKEAAEIKAAHDAQIELAKQGFSTIGELADAFAGKSEAQQKKAFEIKKIASIAQTLIETYQAAQSAYASQMTIPTPDAPVRAAVAAGFAIASGLARVASIKKTKFEGGGGGNNPATPNAPQTTPLTGGTLPDTEAGQFAGMGRVYVLEGDITKTQTRVRRVRNVSVV